MAAGTARPVRLIDPPVPEKNRRSPHLHLGDSFTHEPNPLYRSQDLQAISLDRDGPIGSMLDNLPVRR